MSISFLGSASGLPVNDIISQLVSIQQQPITKLQQQVQQLQQGKNYYGIIKNQVTTLNTTLKKITAQSVLDTDLFAAKTVTSSKEDIITATADSNAAQQSFNVEVKRLASATRAQSSNAVGARNGVGLRATGSTALSDFPGNQFSSGNFTVYVNGTASQVAVNAATDTLTDVLGRIQALSPDITSASVNAEGQLEIQTTGPNKIKFGAAGDTSNFLVRSRLNTTVEDTSGKFTTPYGLSTLNTAVDISSTQANLANPVSGGSTFKINGTSFDTTGKTLDQILDLVNKSSTAGVTASFNTADGTLSLVSKKTGTVAIGLEDTAGNFLASMGLLHSGNSLTAQTLGNNAEVVLNGSTLYSTSNTLGAEVTGLTGLSFDLKSAAVGTTATVTIGQDTSALRNTLKDFVKNFNEVTQGIADMTNPETGSIGIDSRLTGFRNQLRQLVAGGISNGTSVYKSLGAIGISTGAAGATVGGKAPTALQFDESKFNAALSADPNGVKELLAGTTGLLTQLQKVTTQSLSTGTAQTGTIGLFQSASDGTDAKVKTLNSSITRARDRLAAYEASLRKQFQVSDSLISQYQAQSQSLAGILSNSPYQSGR